MATLYRMVIVFLLLHMRSSVVKRAGRSKMLNRDGTTA